MEGNFYMRLRQAGLDVRNGASSRPVVFCGMHGSKSKSTGKSGEILRIFPLSRIRNRNPLAFHLYIFFPNGFHWGTSFRLYLHGFRKYFLAAHTLKGTGEKKAPPSRVGLKYRAGHCSTESSLRCAPLKQALRLTPPAPFFACGPGQF